MKRLFFIVICAFFFIPSLSHGATVGKATLSGRVPTNGLIGYWTFDGGDVVNGMIRDKSGQGNNGNTSGIASSSFYTFGKIGQAGNFDGVNDYVITPAITFNSNLATVSYWFYTTSFNNSDALTMELSSNFNVNVGTFVINHNSSSPSGLMVGGIQDNGFAYRIESFTRPSTNAWHHYVWFFDNSTATGNVDLYIDGVAQTTIGIPNNNKSGTNNFKVDNIYLMSRGGSTLFQNGKIDDIRIYNRALSATEVTALYNSSARGAVTGISPDKGRVTSGGLIGHWTFDGKDMVNGMVRDTSGQENKAYTSGIASSTFFTTGKQGQGLTFDGTNDYLSTTNVLNLAKVTVSAWVKISAIPSTVMDIAHFANGHNSFLHDKVLYIDTAGKARFYVYDGGPKYTSVPSNALPLNTWVHLVGTADGTTATMYVDGVSVGSVAAGDTYTGYNVANFFMGPIAYSSTYIAFRGSMDDVRIYNRALSASEVSALYSSTRGTVTATSPTTKLASGLIGYWTFDGKNVTNGRINDVSGNGNHGNTFGIASSSFYTFGKIGQGGNFDGVDDVVSMGDIVAADNTAQITVAAWIKDTAQSQAEEAYVTKGSSSGFSWKIVGSSASGGCVSFYVNSSGGEAYFCNPAGTDGSWHYFVGTYDGTTVRIYKDGVVSPNTAAVSGLINDRTEHVAVGALGSTGSFASGKYSNALVDEVRIYNRALSVAEIQQLYNMGK